MILRVLLSLATYGEHQPEIWCGFLQQSRSACSGCGVSSVSPFVSGTDIAYDARLVGSWSDSDGKESAVIVRDGDGYGISYTDSDGKVGRFYGILGRLGTRHVLDVFPENLPREKSDLYLSLLVRTHGILVLELADHQLPIRALKVEAITKLLKERPSLVGHVLVPNSFEPKGEDVVLMARPRTCASSCRRSWTDRACSEILSPGVASSLSGAYWKRPDVLRSPINAPT